MNLGILQNIPDRSRRGGKLRHTVGSEKTGVEMGQTTEQDSPTLTVRLPTVRVAAIIQLGEDLLAN